MSDILTRILATKQQEVAAAQAALPLAELRARAADMPPPRGFVQAMRDQYSQGRAALIAEIQPDILVKGGDWAVEQIVGSAETLARGGQVHSIPFVHHTSTTKTLEKIRA